MIHVCFGLSDKDGRYSKFTGTAILSMFENISQPPPCVTVHLLHDNTLTLDNYEKFSYIAGRYGQIIKFYNVEQICADEIVKFKEMFKDYPHYQRFTIGTLFRLLTPQIFSKTIEKLIYLDSDLVVNLDISELWQIQIGDKPLAAVTEFSNRDDIKNVKENFPLCGDGIVRGEDYFNSGVLIMNLKQIRDNEMENIRSGVKFLVENPKFINFDQDILNWCFSKNYVKLPIKFNWIVILRRERGDLQTQQRICHYAGTALNLNMNDDYTKLWFSYFERTPFFNKDVIGRLDIEFRQLNVGLKNFAVQLTALMSGRTRAFFTTLANIDFVKKVFDVKFSEEIILLENQESLNVLANSMENSLGKKIFFILFEGYPQLRAALINAGFVEGRDFINAAMFLSDANGVPFNTYELVRNM